MKPLNFFKELEYTAEIRKAIKETVQNSIVTHLKNVPPEINLDELYQDLAHRIGYFIHLDENPQTASLKDNAWTAIKNNSEKSQQAFKYSNKRQPLHTDYGYVPLNMDITFFFCLKQADHGGATVFLNPGLLISLLKEYEPELYKELTSTDVILGRAGAPHSTNTTKIIDFDKLGPLLSWNYYRVSDQNSQPVKDMAKRFFDFLEEKIEAGWLAKPVILKKGEAVFMQDKRLLHGRNAFFGDRWLMKGAIGIQNVERTKAEIKKILGE